MNLYTETLEEINRENAIKNRKILESKVSVSSKTNELLAFLNEYNLKNKVTFDVNYADFKEVTIYLDLDSESSFTTSKIRIHPTKIEYYCNHWSVNSYSGNEILTECTIIADFNSALPLIRKDLKEVLKRKK